MKLTFPLDSTFTEELPADSSILNVSRKVTGACFSYVTPKIPGNPQLISVMPEVGELVGLTPEMMQQDVFTSIFSGKKVLERTHPFSMCYGGHQFGVWAGQLGDGRAINLFEVLHNNQRWMLQLKGAGHTPYSRSADGLAVLRSSIREYLCSEAMFHLGVPTTRALSLVLTGDEVLRDMLYDGNAAYEKGAIVCRVAPTFIRFGNFQIHAAREELDILRQLVDYTIRHFYPEIGPPSKKAYVELFRQVSERTREMVLHWQRVGFVHGVMNTDNMSILGQTIDYGPYGWLDNYDPDWTPNTTDAQGKRYRYAYQPNIALWNLTQLANALYPLIEESEPFVEVIEHYQAQYPVEYLNMMRQKLGFTIAQPKDAGIVKELERLLQLTETDMTIFFRQLANIILSDVPISVKESLQAFESAFYQPDSLADDVLEQWGDWMAKYRVRLQIEGSNDADRKRRMNQVNPKYVLRNYMAQLAIDAADNGDYSMLEELKKVLWNPYDEQPEAEKWFAKRPDWARTKVGCSMLSCSS